MEKLAIGITGENGAGKGTFVELFQKMVPDQKIAVFKSGEILMQTLQRLSQAFKVEIPYTRTNLQNLALILQNFYGDDVISQAVYQKMIQSQADIVIFDGVRMASDREAIKRFPLNCLVYIKTDPKIRYERLTRRNEKPGEKNMPYEQFLAEEQAATEMEIKKIGADADLTITNNGSLNEFQEQIKKNAFKLYCRY